MAQLADGDGLLPVHDLSGTPVGRVAILARDRERIERGGRITVTFTVRTDKFAHPALGDAGDTVGAYDLFRLADGRLATNCPQELIRFDRARRRRAANLARA